MRTNTKPVDNQTQEAAMRKLRALETRPRPAMSPRAALEALELLGAPGYFPIWWNCQSCGRSHASQDAAIDCHISDERHAAAEVGHTRSWAVPFDVILRASA